MLRLQSREYEREHLLSTVGQAHAGLSEAALKLRLGLPPKTPVLKTAIKAERATFDRGMVEHCSKFLSRKMNNRSLHHTDYSWPPGVARFVPIEHFSLETMSAVVAPKANNISH